MITSRHRVAVRARKKQGRPNAKSDPEAILINDHDLTPASGVTLMSALNWLPPIVGAFSGALIAVFSKPLQDLVFRPVLTLHFDQSDHYITRTPKGDHEAMYVDRKSVV